MNTVLPEVMGASRAAEQEDEPLLNLPRNIAPYQSIRNQDRTSTHDSNIYIIVHSYTEPGSHSSVFLAHDASLWMPFRQA